MLSPVRTTDYFQPSRRDSILLANWVPSDVSFHKRNFHFWAVCGVRNLGFALPLWELAPACESGRPP
jgi:hypothetical protein